jgi:hypothetical protein
MVRSQEPPARMHRGLEGQFDNRVQPGSGSLRRLALTTTDEEVVLVITVLELLKPTGPLRELPQRLASAAKLAKIIQDGFLCMIKSCYDIGKALMSNTGYKYIYKTRELLHCDVSINNLMYRGTEGHISGALIDCDLAVIASIDPTQYQGSKQRTGTKLFMAIDLLDQTPKDHAFNHDLESFFYCYLWMLVRTQNHRLDDSTESAVRVHPFEFWQAISIPSLQSEKINLVIKKHIPPMYEEFGNHIAHWQYMLDLVGLAQVNVIPKRRNIPSLSRKEAASPVLSFSDFDIILCGEDMNGMKGDITNAPSIKELLTTFRVV